MKKFSVWLILLNLALLVGFFTRSVIVKEQLLRNGNLVLLELARGDKRKINQGDNRRLRDAL